MTRTIVVAALVAVLAGGCKKSDTSAASGSGSGSGSADVEVDAMVNEMSEFTERMVPLILAFDGDCAAQAKRMLTLEPLATKLRASVAALDADPARQAAVRAQIAGRKADSDAKMKATLSAAGATDADVTKKGADMDAKCGSDPAFQDALKRAGVRKKQ